MLIRAIPFLGVVTLLALPAFAATEIELSEEFPIRGTAVNVRVSGLEEDGHYLLRAIYRPNSETAKTEDAGLLGEENSMAWTPTIAGITSLQVLDGDSRVIVSRDIAVRFDSPPLSGILVFLGAGILLFGGATIFMRKALES